ncbi:helix-turn-helix transcriptional regulator [Citrobacter amalonaticus]|nr:LuxR C-terminal-related transcriptional regulator [Citrobacter amalonaticus]
MIKQMEYREQSSPLSLCLYVMAGMDPAEIFTCLTLHPPTDFAIFISAKRHYDLLNRLSSELTTLCVAEHLTLSELRQTLAVMEMLRRQNAPGSHAQNHFKFTRAEQQIMQLTLRGHSIDEIARIRGVSPVTISVQRSGLMKRTGTKSILELCALYRAYQSTPHAAGYHCHAAAL